MKTIEIPEKYLVRTKAKNDMANKIALTNLLTDQPRTRVDPYLGLTYIFTVEEISFKDFNLILKQHHIPFTIIA